MVPRSLRGEIISSRLNITRSANSLDIRSLFFAWREVEVRGGGGGGEVNGESEGREMFLINHSYSITRGGEGEEGL